ncbi:MAG: PDZ domain-containing protein, partial [Acidobacteriaceae bacterium]|nr:PDZ domain-containing protein [Acidobacteriaceae bacterium]
TGDVIFQLNGQQVTSIENLRRMLSSLPPGAPVVLQVQRDDRLQYLSFTLD